MDTRHAKEFKEKFLNQLRDQQYTDLILAAFALEQIPDLEKVNAALRTEQEANQKELDSFDRISEPPKYETRQRIKGLVTENEDLQDKIGKINKGISALQAESQSLHAKASEQGVRIKFVEENFPKLLENFPQA